MKTVRGIIFDCDGVLFESRQANLAYYNAVLAHFRAEPVSADDRERAHLCHTAASPRVFEVLLGSERVTAAMEVAGRLSYRQFIPFMTPEPDLTETLGRLAGSLPLAVATNRGGSMGEILRHFALEEYFQVVVTSRDVLRPKPHPEMLLLAAERLARAPEELLFVGDSELDCQAALGAGIPFVAYKGAGVDGPAVAGHRELAERILGEGIKGSF